MMPYLTSLKNKLPFNDRSKNTNQEVLRSSITSMMHQASRDGDIEKLREELEELYEDYPEEDARKQALCHRDHWGLTALHYAVKYNHLEIVQMLVENGADVNVRGKKGARPIHYFTCFSRGSDASILQYLISCDADINALDDNNFSPLHFACSKGNLKVVQILTQCKGIQFEAFDRLKNTSLHCACSYGDIVVVDTILDCGANLLAENEAGFTPLHVACSQGHEKLLNHLFAIVEAKFGYGKLASVLEMKNSEGQGLLHLAVLASHYNITKNLLERGCNVESPMEGNDTVLHVAAVSCDMDMIELILRFMSFKVLDKPNDKGRTALHYAARFGKHKIVSLFLERGADINCQDNNKATPIIMASGKSGNAKTVQIMMRKGADILMADREDCTALHVATKENNLDAVKTLLTSPEQREEMINTKNKDSNTCLHVACAQGYEDIATLLMEKGADVKSRNYNNETPLHLAAFYGQNDVVDNIIDIDTSTINDNDSNGNSPLHMAAESGNFDVIKYLLKSGASINDKNALGLTPLEIAASNGQTDAAKALIWGGAATGSRCESTGLNALHYASIGGNCDMIEYLLEYCDIEETDLTGRNALDHAIDNLNKDAVYTILSHRDWKLALRNKTLDEDKRLTTPLRKLIKRMPEVAQFVFDRCISSPEDRAVDNPDYELVLNYEFIDDVYNDWPCDIVRHEAEEGQKKGDVFTKKKIQRLMEQKETHTFSYMVAYDREDLVSHPLIQASLNKKWQKFAAYLYYFKLLLYIFFLTSLTGYILVTAPLREPYRSKDCSIVTDNATWEMMVFVHYGKFAVIGLALVHLLFEVFQMIGQLRDYLQLDNLLEWFIYILAIANVIDDFIVLPFLKNGLICGTYQKSFGSLGLFLSWLNFVLFIRKVPVFGIYIVMFLYVFKTFFKFFVVFIFFIATFAFAFFILLRDGQSPAFKNPWTSLVKVGVMMTGELGFDELFFYGGGKVDPILWIIFIIFVLVLNIILMNLLVGLAVDDIAGVQKQAEFTKSTMQIDICLQAEITLPKIFRTRFVVKSQKLCPNKDDLPNNISNKSYVNIKEILLKSKEADSSVQDSLKSLQSNMTQLTVRINKISDEITDIETLNGKLSDLKSMMKDIWKHQRRQSKKQQKTIGAGTPKGSSGDGRDEDETKKSKDETKTEDDETFDDAHAQTYEDDVIKDKKDDAED